ncbi:MAG TPA: hypothetical protein VG518_07135, partial [Solirubrobacterales bacterium]|nr:hypothetical protein [Solirubrobacterales bacterium]
MIQTASASASENTRPSPGPRWRFGAPLFLAALLLLVASAPPPALAEQAASYSRAFQEGRIDSGGGHTCAVLGNGTVRCWGNNAFGQLGYGNTKSIGDDEAPATAGPVDLGGHRAIAVSVGGVHSCALLDNGTVRCWGYNAYGQLGYGNTENVGDNETPASVGAVNLGAGRTATAISAGGMHTCALLDNGTVRCWGFNAWGQLGYGNTTQIGDNETPAAAGPVDLGGRNAVAISAGVYHTCALLDDGSVRCWGRGDVGALGYGNTENVGDNETPGSVAPVELGRDALAISAGEVHTCALLVDGALRCWGYGALGELGHGDTETVGDDETPASVAAVDLGAEAASGRYATAISGAGSHTCAILDNGTVRCWGYPGSGQLGYGNTAQIGDNETPGSVAPVQLGAGRSAVALATGSDHTCALLDNGTVRCWGSSEKGQLGYGNVNSIGDDESPASAGPVDLGGRNAVAISAG